MSSPRRNPARSMTRSATGACRAIRVGEEAVFHLALDFPRRAASWCQANIAAPLFGGDRKRHGGRAGLAPEGELRTLLALLDRLCTMLTRLAHMGDRASGSA